MPSLTDFFFDGGVGPEFSFADTGLERGLDTVDAGLKQGLVQRESLTRTLPDETNRSASRGSFFSGGHIERQRRNVEDAETEGGLIQYQLNNGMADMARKQLLASMGIQL